MNVISSEFVKVKTQIKSEQDIIKLLTEYKKMKDNGVLSEEEFGDCQSILELCQSFSV